MARDSNSGQGPPNRIRRPGAEAAHFENTGNGNSAAYSRPRADPQPVELSDLRFSRQVERLHRLGPRLLYEFLVELSRDRLIRLPIEAMVERYVQRLDCGTLAAAGADKLVASPIHGVEP